MKRTSEKALEKKADNTFKKRKKPYQNSMRKRINTDYVVSYIIVGIVMLFVFMVTYGYHYVHSLIQNTPLIASEIKMAYIESNGAIDSHFISRLNSIVSMGSADVINIYGGDGSLLLTTAEKAEKTVRQSGVLSDLSSAFNIISKGIYYDDCIISDINLRLVVGYSLSGIRDDYRFTIVAYAIIILFGTLVFTFTGYARIQGLLKPIEEMTDVVRDISSENLDLRVDEENAQYELKDLATTVNDMIDRLEDSYDRQKHFVSDVSHELRTPISVISGYASMLKRWGTSDEEVLNESIEAIINEADNMQNLVEALLFLTRHDNKSIQYKFSSFNLSELVEEVVRDTQIVHTQFLISTDIEENVILTADDARVKQLIRIFLENAIKYSGDSRKVIVAVQQRTEGAVIKVIDFGIGIEKKDIDKIFDRFYRADESRTKLISGYGLGLSMAKEIIRGLKGKINVKSKIGEGSEFSAYIPNAKMSVTQEVKKNTIQ